MANPCDLQTIGKAICVVSSVLILCSCDGKQKQEVAQKTEDFLSKFDPKLKTVRDGLIAEIASVDENISKVKKLKRGFNQESAKEIAQQKINRLQEQKNELTAHLSRIDAEAEKGVMLREMNQIDGGGTVSSTNRELLEESEKTLAESRKMTQTLENEFGGSVSQSNTSHISQAQQTALRPSPPSVSQNSTQFTVQLYRVCNIAPGSYLSIRSRPQLNGDIVARIPVTATGIEVVGEAVNADTVQWAPIRYGRLTGFANSNNLMLAESPVVAQISPGKPSDSIQKAIALYPELQMKDSPMNREFLKIYNGRKAAGDKTLLKQDWPLIIAKEAAAAIAR